MSTPSKRRLIRDFKRLSNDPPGGISGAPCPDNLMIWNAVIFGPADTPFEDGTFKLVLTFDESYPNKPPTVKFLSRMFHPNVYANGELCLDILQNRWSPTYDVAAILTSIQSLLHDPNPNSPANAEAASLYRENMKEYVRRVKSTVEESWMDDDVNVEELKAEVEAEGADEEEEDTIAPVAAQPSSAATAGSHMHVDASEADPTQAGSGSGSAPTDADADKPLQPAAGDGGAGPSASAN